jgi:hypothetical protein
MPRNGNQKQGVFIMKYISVFCLWLFTPLLANASECALSLDEGLAAVLAQQGTLQSVLCERNVNADLEITAIFRCSSGAEFPVTAFVDRAQGESSCGVQWFMCDGTVNGYQTPFPVTGKSAAEDFAAIRNACGDLL